MKPFTRGATKAMRALWNFPIRAMNKGVHINSPHVIGEKLADGRMRLHLAQLASPAAAPEEPLLAFCENVFIIAEGQVDFVSTPVPLTTVTFLDWTGTFGGMSNGPYITFDSENIAKVDVSQARADGLWSIDTSIVVTTDFTIPDGGSDFFIEADWASGFFQIAEGYSGSLMKDITVDGPLTHTINIHYPNAFQVPML